MLLKHTAIQQPYNNHTYKMCRFYLKFTVFKVLSRNDNIICCCLQMVSFPIGSLFYKHLLLSDLNWIRDRLEN
jgi:hypothetical protein